MASRPRSQRRTPSSADRSRPSRLLAFIAARSAAPLASVPISAIADSIIATLAPTLTDPVGAAAGEVGVGIDLSTAQPSVGAALGEVGAGVGGDRQAFAYASKLPRNRPAAQGP